MRFASPFLLFICALVLIPNVMGEPSSQKRKKNSPKTTQKSRPLPNISTNKKEDNASSPKIVAISSPDNATTTPIAPSPINPINWLKKNALFQAGMHALQDHIPDLAIRNFNDLLTQSPPAETLPLLYRQLGEAYIRHDNFSEGLQVLRNKDVEGLDGTLFWMGVANKGLGRLSSALRLFNSVEKQGAISQEMQTALYWQMAEIQTLLGNNALVKELLTKLTNSPSPQIQQAAKLALAGVELTWQHWEKSLTLAESLLTATPPLPLQATSMAKLIKAQCLHKLNNPLESIPLLSSILAEPAVAQQTKDHALLSLAEAEIQAQNLTPETPLGETTGIDRLLLFIESEPNTSVLSTAFDILLKNKAFDDADTLKKLTDWANNKHPQRSPHAAKCLAEFLINKNNTTPLIPLVTTVSTQAPENPATIELQCIAIQHLITEKKLNEAQHILDKMSDYGGKKDLLQASLDYAQKNYDKALSHYTESINKLSLIEGDLAKIALQNAALAALQDAQPKELKDINNSAQITKKIYLDIQLETALCNAAQLEDIALTQLKSFIKKYPDHPRIDEAYLALGEFSLYQDPPNEEDVMMTLLALREKNLPEELKERMMRLRIMLPEYGGQTASAIQAAKEYIDQFPQQEKKEPMQLKIGELIYRQGDYNQAHLYLQNLIGRISPSNPIYGPALLLSAKAAQQINNNNSLDTALALFRQLTTSSPSYKDIAGIEIASILMRQGKSKEVIPHLDNILKTPNLNAETRNIALALKADAWSAQATHSPEALTKAKEATTELLNTPALPLAWKLRTLFQRAQIEERLNDPTAALQDYYAIIAEIPSSPQRKDWYWHYQAGFSALHLLETQKNWQAAIKLAKSMAESGGPRAEEALNRARKIRLENFVWGEE